jgi:hypothetical protein
VKLMKILVDLVRASTFVLAALALGGCSLTIPEALTPDAQPGGDYYEGYMAGRSFADDAWHRVGRAATWLDEHSLTATDVAIQKALMNLPPSIVESKSSVWIEAFRAGASTRFDQYQQAVRKRSREQYMAVAAVSIVALLVLLATGADLGNPYYY